MRPLAKGGGRRRHVAMALEIDRHKVPRCLLGPGPVIYPLQCRLAKLGIIKSAVGDEQTGASSFGIGLAMLLQKERQIPMQCGVAGDVPPRKDWGRSAPCTAQTDRQLIGRKLLAVTDPTGNCSQCVAGVHC